MKRSEFLVCVALTICGLPYAASATAALYTRLGGEPPLRRVIEGLYARMLADPRTRDRFVDVDMARLKNQVFTFIAQAAGGPQKYIGKDIRFIHTKLKITEIEWAATVAALSEAMDQLHVGDPEKHDVLALIGSLKSDIVHPPA